MRKIFKWPVLKLNDRLKQGFTLIEILVAMSISVLIVAVIYGVYVSSNRYYYKNLAQAELTQNGRIALERISRDLRQAVRIIASLPSNENDMLNPPPSEIFFQDGHNTTKIQYIRYKLIDNTLKRELLHYYFATNSSVWVNWNSKDQMQNPPIESIDESVVKADKISSLQFYGTKNITISLTVSDGINNFSFKTEVFGRNIQ